MMFDDGEKDKYDDRWRREWWWRSAYNMIDGEKISMMIDAVENDDRRSAY